MHYIYLIRVDNLFKIGRTKNPKQRLTQLKTANILITNYCIVFLLKSQYKSSEIENLLHILYKKRKINREWFELDLEDLENMKIFMKDKIERMDEIETLAR